MEIPPHIRYTAVLMAEELEANRLEVLLTPSTPRYQPTERKKRTVISQNPRWYQELCREWPKNRSRPRRSSKPDTRITRRETLYGLYQIATGKVTSEYAQRLLHHIEKYHESNPNE